jgi:hypothetical protein
MLPPPRQITYALRIRSCRSKPSGIVRAGPWPEFPGLVLGGASHRSLRPFACVRHSGMRQWPSLRVSPSLQAKTNMCIASAQVSPSQYALPSTRISRRPEGADRHVHLRATGGIRNGQRLCEREFVVNYREGNKFGLTLGEATCKHSQYPDVSRTRRRGVPSGGSGSKDRAW